ncbi:hypothetical protein ZWY2020_049439 [Hordeum vulgare]|nr:hypothetical protein ZWY2020_049439 [Hordeum vulgare]
MSTSKLGMAFKKDDSFGEWYSEVVVNSEIIEYHDISGCYILRPWAMEIWELLKEFFDAEIKKLKLKSYYFPLLVTENVVQKKKDHFEGFAPEVAWVTKTGKSELEAPFAIRPTGEAVMYPYFARWIRSHRDLPLRCNQWCSVVRSSEFLLQEGHTVFATKEEADEEVLHILELYRRIYEEFLAVPVSKGWKSEMEKFAGGLYTTSVEAFIPNTGLGIQGATSNCLGQNFAKIFEIFFEDEKDPAQKNNEKDKRSLIGVMVMTHGDDKGLVLPPRVAPIQVIIIPDLLEDTDTTAINGACETIVCTLNQAGIRADLDARENYYLEWKYSHWEMKGVPLRIEIDLKDLANKQVRVVRRDKGAKVDIRSTDLVEHVKVLLAEIQDSLFETAKEKRDACIEVISTWDEFTAALNDKKLILAPWCDEGEVEKDVRARTEGADLGSAKTLCTPFDQPDLMEGTVCFACGKPAKTWSFWGRSY